MRNRGRMESSSSFFFLLLLFSFLLPALHCRFSISTFFFSVASMADPSISSLSAQCRTLESLLLDAFSSFSSLLDSIAADHPNSPLLLHSIAANQAVKRLSELQRKLKWHLRANGISSRSSRYGHDVDARNLDDSLPEPRPDFSVRQEEAVRELQRWKKEAEKKEGEIWRLNATVERLVKKKEMLEQKVRKLESKLAMSGGAAAEEAISRAMAVSPAAAGEEERYDNDHDNDDDDDEEQRIWRCSSNGVGGADPAAEMEMVLGKEQIAKGMVKKAAEMALQRTSELAMAMAEKMKEADIEMEMEVEMEAMAVKWAAEKHKALAVKAYVSKKMFAGFQNEDFFMSGELRSLLHPHRHRYECWQQYRAMAEMDPLPFLLAGDLQFGQFCRKKFLCLFDEEDESRGKRLPEPYGGSFRQGKADSGRFRQEAAVSGRFRQDPVGSGKFRQDPVDSGKFRQDPVGSGKFRKVPEGSGKFRHDWAAGSGSPGGGATPCRKKLPDKSINILPLLFGGALAEDLPRALAVADHPLLAAFVRSAHAVWIFHRLAFAICPSWRPSPFWAAPGSQFSSATMCAAVDGVSLAGDGRIPSVAFSVLPGFRSGAQQVLVRCAVYLNSGQWAHVV